MSPAEPARPVVVAMLKAPRAGTVKTRLAHEIGSAAAASVYRRLVEHQLASIPREWRTEIHFAPADAAAKMQGWLGSHHDYHAQSGRDLGERLIHAIAGAFDRAASRRHPPTRGPNGVLVIGGDCPGLDTATLHTAYSALATADVVVGPALDGGYYLIGLRRPAPALFAEIPWSSSAVLAATMARAHASGLSSALLSPKEDVDDLASWRRLQALLPVVERNGDHIV